jgi:hypothetical protein
VTGEHDQKRADAFAKYVMEKCEHIDKPVLIPGRVVHVMVSHDDWCKTMKTGNGYDCTSNPNISYHLQPKDSVK